MNGTGRTPPAGRTALAALALVAALLAVPAGTATGAGQSSPAAAPGVPETFRPASPLPVPTAPERETCADGSDPAAGLRPSGEAGPAVRRIQERGRLVVGVDQNSYLWGFRAPGSGEITGFDIDLVRAVAEDLLGERPTVVYRAVPTAERIPRILDGTLDMVVRTMSVTCERREHIAFSTAYFEAGQQMLAPHGSPVTGWDASLRDARVCAARGSTAADLLAAESHGAATVLVPHQLDCLVRVQLGEADAVMTDNALAAGQAAQDPAMRLVGEPVTVEPYAIAMHPDDEDLIRRVNRVLEEFRGDGGPGSPWRDSYDRWLAGHLGDRSPRPPGPVYRD
ncbi:glutamate ABC transporter substrate-binding protein [Streptomyces sodiiphilus]|uniref:Glutamate ABC transporter substrate-binding protein n=1 Tax=Streptomyces sodiiphilus TaxID=226217 RepID=A0ABP5A574_9ACTN